MYVCVCRVKTLEDGTDRLTRNVGTECVISQKSLDLYYELLCISDRVDLERHTERFLLGRSRVQTSVHSFQIDYSLTVLFDAVNYVLLTE